MPTQDPNNKNSVVNGVNENSYDADNKVTNTDNPVREGQENSSILYDEAPVGDAQYTKLTEYDDHPREQEEFVDDDKVNYKPED
jgi:hypothetical protein